MNKQMHRKVLPLNQNLLEYFDDEKKMNKEENIGLREFKRKK